MTVANAKIVQPDRILSGWLQLADGRIAEIGPGTPPGIPDHDLEGRLVVPGFVDMHAHGGAGGSYPSGDRGEARLAHEFHLNRGTTTMVASLVTASLADLVTAITALAELCEEGLFAGIHLEGPYLAPARCGAHDPEQLRDPDRAELAALLDAGRGHIRMVTIAPELVGGNGRTSGVDLVRDVVAWGAIAAVGHTEATYEQTRAAIDAGARVATHLFNAMRPLNHREPGPIGAALDDDQMTIELINDGVHVSPTVARVVFAAAAGRVALVTDAMAAAGLGDGDYRLGPTEITVRGGRAMVAGGTSIAGSTISMSDAFRNAVGVLGLPLEVAVSATSLVPARALGVADEVGSLEAGKRADLVVLDAGLEPVGVMRAGTWVRSPDGPPAPPINVARSEPGVGLPGVTIPDIELPGLGDTEALAADEGLPETGDGLSEAAGSGPASGGTASGGAADTGVPGADEPGPAEPGAGETDAAAGGALHGTDGTGGAPDAPGTGGTETAGEDAADDADDEGGAGAAGRGESGSGRDGDPGGASGGPGTVFGGPPGAPGGVL